LCCCCAAAHPLSAPPSRASCRDVPLVNFTSFIGNTVNPDQQIGVISIQNADKIGPGVHCSANTPPAVLGKSPCPA